MRDIVRLRSEIGFGFLDTGGLMVSRRSRLSSMALSVSCACNAVRIGLVDESADNDRVRDRGSPEVLAEPALKPN